MKKNFSAVVDMRFDQLGDLTLAGVEVNSFESVKLFVDKLKSIGYSSISFATNVPVDINSGEIVELDPSAGGNRFKTEPKDLWALCSYANSIGLDVAIKLDIVDYRNDNIIGFWTDFGRNFSLTKFFDSVLNYEKQLAIKAEKSGVDVFYVGNFSNGLDTEEYRTEWSNIVNNIRQVFNGKLAYSSNSNRLDAPAVLWDLVDIIGLGFSPEISRDAIYDIQEIVKKYYNSDNLNGRGVVDEISEIRKYRFYNKEIILDAVEIPAANIGWMKEPFWQLLLNNNLKKDQFNIDYEFQSIRFQSIFHLLENDLNDNVSGVTFREYMPWHEASWIEDPGDETSKMWRLAKDLSFSLYDNKYAESTLRTYLKYDYIPLVDGPSKELSLLGGPEDGQFISDDLWVLFTNKVAAENGSVYLLDSNKRVIEKFDINSKKVELVNNALIINPSKNLNYNSKYYLQIDENAVKDAFGNKNSAIYISFTSTDSVITTSSKYTIKSQFQKVSYFGDKNFNGIGSKYDDTISGGFGNDSLSGRMGNDSLAGSSGNDSFVFNSKLGPSNIDTITDFTPGIDKIALGKNIFKAFARDKAIQAENLVYGNSAIDNDDYIIYDQITGKLYYDADGSGSKSQAIQIALIGTGSHPLLTPNDFTII